MPLCLMGYGVLADRKSPRGMAMGAAWLRMKQSDGNPLYVKREFEILDAEVGDQKLLEIRAKSEMPKLSMMLLEILLKGGYADQNGPHMVPGFTTFKLE